MENKIEGVCYIYGEPLVWDEMQKNCYLNDYMEDEEGTIVKEIQCKHCGTLYQHYITKDNDADSEEDYITCGDQGFGNCAHCGCSIEVWEPSPNEMKSGKYPYWEGHSKENHNIL